MTFELVFTDEARANLKKLEDDSSKKAVLKAVRKTLGLMETNLKHPGLCTHKYQSIKGPRGEEVFETYAQNQTPGAYRIFWYYGPEKNRISITAIVPHP
ncbi:MAG: hypothetical protein HYU99_07205 [Deltaproteobacteria bacterium]|nr:hypothetical protein [Deltaproteobacteria bacterium]